jgi:arylsulfatase A-like enzyme
MRILGSLVILLSVIFTIACAEEPVPKHNVILIVIDTLRANHMSHYGYDLRTDVNLDGFRDQSTLFTRCYAPAPWTLPSVASLITGLFTARHQMNVPGNKLPDDALTLAELYKQNGWTTVGYSFNPGISRRTAYDQGFDQWDDHLGSSKHYPDISDMFLRVRNWLDTDPREPFFLYLQPMNCHGPYRTPRRFLGGLLGRRPAKGFKYYDERMKAVLERRDRSGITQDYLESLVEQYDTAVWYSSYQLSVFFKLLKSRGVYDNSWIILTSDHGEELYDHGGFSHGYSLHEEVLHVPLYIKRPGQRKGVTVSEQVSLMDVYPTLAEIMGADVDHLLDGQSLVPYLDEEQSTEDLAAARTQLHQAGWKSRCDGRAIVSGNYKLIEIERDWSSDQRKVLLFDIELDPAEKQNLAEKKPELVRRLRNKLDDRFAHYRSLALSTPENVLDEMDTARLKALGYLE